MHADSESVTCVSDGNIKYTCSLTEGTAAAAAAAAGTQRSELLANLRDVADACQQRNEQRQPAATEVKLPHLKYIMLRKSKPLYVSYY